MAIRMLEKDRLPVFSHFYTQAMKHGLPIGIAPNVKVSLIMLPEECRELTDNPGAYKLTRTKLWAMKKVFGAWFNARVKA